MNPYAIVGGLLLLIATWFGGQYQGGKIADAKNAIVVQGLKDSAAKRELNLQKGYTEALATELQVREDERKSAQKITDKVILDHEKAITKLKQEAAAIIAAKRAAGGLRISAASCATVEAIATKGEATGTGQLDGEAAGTIRLPERIESDLFQLMTEADAVVEGCRSLQNWVRANGFYGPAKE